MTQRSIRARGVHVLLASCGMAAVAACTPSGPSSPYAVISANGEPFRSAFNRDTGKIRVVMLVAPT